MTRSHSPSLIGRSAALRDLEEQLTCAAKSDAKVLITGESGVGKEIAARLIHASSDRAMLPIVTLNCAGMPETLLESELFGYTRGSFTGAVRDKRGLLEEAHGGTVFLDEVGEMSLRMQSLLLRFLETGEIQRVGAVRPQQRVDVRIISATNRELKQAVGTHEFRKDLYYRLNVIHVRIPPLRDRPDDIPPLVDHYLRAFSEQYHVPPPALSPDVRTRLEAYAWPGNVRELRNVLERIVVMRRGGEVELSDLPPDLCGLPEAPPPPDGSVVARADDLFDTMVNGRQSFWSVVYGPFMSRDLTRADLRQLVVRGLRRTGGSYKLLVALFNIDTSDYRRFLNFLSKHECHVDFQPFRVVPEVADAQPDAQERTTMPA